MLYPNRVTKVNPMVDEIYTECKWQNGSVIWAKKEYALTEEPHPEDGVVLYEAIGVDKEGEFAIISWYVPKGGKEEDIDWRHPAKVKRCK